jgi:hypothetical protein
MPSRADILARKMKIEEAEEQEARQYCSSDDEECIKMAKALVRIRKLAEKQKKFHAFEKFAYQEIDESLREAGF